jgi:hypothetical protein
MLLGPIHAKAFIGDYSDFGSVKPGYEYKYECMMSCRTSGMSKNRIFGIQGEAETVLPSNSSVA